MKNYIMNNNYYELNDESNNESNNEQLDKIKNINTNNKLSYDNKYNTETNDDFNIWSIWSIFKYILSKPIEFLLLISVFIIIYSVDYISRLNSVIYGVSQSIPFMGQQPQTQSQIQIQNPLKLSHQKKRKNK